MAPSYDNVPEEGHEEEEEQLDFTGIRIMYRQVM